MSEDMAARIKRAEALAGDGKATQGSADAQSRTDKQASGGAGVCTLMVSVLALCGFLGFEGTRQQNRIRYLT